MRVSIIIPAFNKAQLTRNCLNALAATVGDAADVETILVDNGSSDETPRMLQEFPWVRVIRNERNRGFAAANNQAAREARGAYLVLLNNDTQPLPGWLDAMLSAADATTGVVGARLLFPDGTLQHAGVVAVPSAFGPAGFTMVHDLYRERGDDPRALLRRDLQAVTAACLLTPRELYLELGGLDERFWNGNEDVDYCLRVRRRGLRVVYEPQAALLHFESKSGVERFRRSPANTALLAGRWNGNVRADRNEHAIARGEIFRPMRGSRGQSYWDLHAIPPIAVVVYGENESANAQEIEARIRANRAPVSGVLFCRGAECVAQMRRAMELRGQRYIAFVDTSAQLNPGWLDELLQNLESGASLGAVVREDESGNARTLLSLRRFPAHYRLGDAASPQEALADFLTRATRELHLGVKNLTREPDERALEALLREREPRKRGLVSIVTLSWNAPEFTKIALDSIRAHTSGPYEVIVVDNGSRAETTDWLKTLGDVRVIFNDENRGFAGGTNQGFAAARGEYVVMLNNDVIVTEGWLDGLLEPFDRIPGLGVSAPRSNKVAGHQQLADCEYADVDAMQRFAAGRRARLRRSGYITDRAIGLCLCIDRRVIEEIGGIDTRFGIGNFEDDDFCMRVRGAGYKIYVCDDVFIHHFGSQSFAANNVDYAATMNENWRKFALKWGYDASVPVSGYDARIAISKGFERAAHFVPLPEVTPA